ncbi:MAG TPA: acetyl-CoA carboxylase biotin carboxyl carrier protein [Candidatus Eisenbacteria bacterium]|nr:acetyl-CoA carboxylase biotin carboxyl carrier protein [Candidatus Eisenbacteria bacterium]
MNQKEIKELIELLVEKDIAEFEMERGDVKLHIRRGGTEHVPHVVQLAAPAVPIAPVAAPIPGPPTTTAVAAEVVNPAAVAPATAAEDEANLHVVKSPIVGTFYEAASPGAPPFVAVGDWVKEGQVLCIIEAMKLMNEIEADASGEIVKRFVNNGSPVEYGMALFGIRKK